MVKYFNLSPHEKVVAKWKETNFLPDISANGYDKVASRILAAIGKGKLETLVDPQSPDKAAPRTEEYIKYTEERPDSPIAREISHFYRQKTRDGEFMFFKQKLSNSNFQGDKDYQVTFVVGRYPEPQYTFITNKETGVRTVTGAKEPKLVYETPFTTEEFEDPSTHEKTTLEELKKFTTEKMWFYVYVNGIKYELLGTTYEEFCSRSYEDLVHRAVHLRWPEQAQAAIAEKPKRKAA